MEDEPISIFDKIYQELKSGNPIIILVILFVAVALAGWWVFQTVQTPIVDLLPTPRVRHRNIKTLPVSKPNDMILTQVSMTPTPSSTPGPTLLRNPLKTIRVVGPNRKTFSLSFLAGAFNERRSLSR